MSLSEVRIERDGPLGLGDGPVVLLHPQIGAAQRKMGVGLGLDQRDSLPGQLVGQFQRLLGRVTPTIYVVFHVGESEERIGGREPRVEIDGALQHRPRQSIRLLRLPPGLLASPQEAVVTLPSNL